MSKKLHDRISRLERALPDLPTRTHPYWQEFDRRVRISRLYMAWQKGEIEKPKLTDARDVERWAHMETVMRTAKTVVEESTQPP